LFLVLPGSTVVGQGAPSGWGWVEREGAGAGAIVDGAALLNDICLGLLAVG